MILGVRGAARQAMTASGLSGTKRANTTTPRAESRRNRWIRGARPLVRTRSSRCSAPDNMATRSGRSRLSHRTSSECVFPGAKLREYGHAIRQIAPGMARRCGANLGLGRTQKWIGRAHLAEGRRQRRLSPVAFVLLALQTCSQCRALWFNCEREAKVRNRVLMPAVDASARRKRGELVERCHHLRGGPLEQSSAAGGEQSVAAEHDFLANARNVPGGVSRYIEHR